MTGRHTRGRSWLDDDPADDLLDVETFLVGVAWLALCGAVAVLLGPAVLGGLAGLAWSLLS